MISLDQRSWSRPAERIHRGVENSAVAFDMAPAAETEPETETEADTDAETERLIAMGAQLFDDRSCDACHSLDGEPVVGPSLGGIFGKEHRMTDGTVITVDEDYLRQSIESPDARVRLDYSPIMPSYKGSLSADEVSALVAFLVHAEQSE